MYQPSPFVVTDKQHGCREKNVMSYEVFFNEVVNVIEVKREWVYYVSLDLKSTLDRVPRRDFSEN